MLAALAEEGATGARDRPGPAGAASTALLDTEVLTVSGAGMRVVLNLRMVFALSGMGFAPAAARTRWCGSAPPTPGRGSTPGTAPWCVAGTPCCRC